MKRKFIYYGLAIISSIASAGAIYLVGKNDGERRVLTDLIKDIENHTGPMIIEDHDTHLIYEVTGECIGD